MIAEDYVNFETAKLLKKKGFEQHRTKLAYNKNGKRRWSDDLDPFEFSAPTLQMAMKWLREVHNIIITMDYDEYELGKNDTKQVGYGWNIQKIENPTKYLKISEHVFDTYEESCEDAIKYCLTDLIK